MHDPDVVAFTIRRPWPRRDSMPRGTATPRRWEFRLHHSCGSWCEDKQHRKNPFPWWRPRSWTPFWTLAGRRIYWPDMITVWHREPGGADSGDVCKHYRRWQNADGKWDSKITDGWRWHVWHWHIQVAPLQHLRRWALTRCEWCGGRSTKTHRVNFGTSWYPAKTHWWQSAVGVMHHGCHSASTLGCHCDEPLLVDGPYGPAAYRECTRCGRVYHDKAGWETARRAVALAGIPVKGQLWEWPDDLTYAKVKAELKGAA